MEKYECGDCLYNMGDCGDGCECEKTGKKIALTDNACKWFKKYFDLEE